MLSDAALYQGTTLQRLRKNSFPSSFVSGHNFTASEKSRLCTALCQGTTLVVPIRRFFLISREDFSPRGTRRTLSRLNAPRRTNSP